MYHCGVQRSNTINKQTKTHDMKNANANTPDLSELNTKIANLEAEIAADTTTLAESIEAGEKIREIFANEDYKNPNFEDYSCKSRKASNVATLARFIETLKMDLIIVNTKYIMLEAGQSLTNPAGFDHDSRVFVEPKGQYILTDKLPKYSNLGYIDVEKTFKV